MDAGDGAFEPITAEQEAALREAQEHELRAIRKAMGEATASAEQSRDLPRVFSIGQQFELNGSRLKVAKIAKRRLILKLLADHE
jgi:hypothetical protein